MNYKDFKRVPKTHPKYKQRWYIDSNGNTLSHRAYQQLSKGGLTPEFIAQARKRIGTDGTIKGNRFTKFITDYKKKTAAKLGISPSKVKVRGQSEEAILFRARFRELMNYNKKVKDGKIKPDYSPHGKLAKMLEDLNFREKDWDFPVNESPTDR